jgi:hypothetical protein
MESMMKKRPTILVILGAFLAMLALAAPLQIMIFDDHGWNLPAVLSHLSYFQWVVLILGLTASALVIEASQWVRVVLPVLTFVVLGHHLLHWHHHEVSFLNMSLATVGLVALNVPLIHPNIMTLMNYPERRWWRSSPRKRAELPIYLGGCLKGEVRSITYEVSETGAFVTFPPGPPPQFQVDERVSICITLGVLNQVRCMGRVVRVAEPRGIYPRGVAVEFEGLPWGSKRDLKRFISSR